MKKVTKKAPKKRVEYSDSDSDETIERPPPPNWGRSKQNRKSSLRVHNKPDVKDYFCS